MPTELTTRGGLTIRNDPFGGGLAGSVLLHGAIIALLIGSAWFLHTGQNWGNSSANTGTIQATIVGALPLPPKVTPDHENVLATENPSPAPPPPPPQTRALPQPHPHPRPSPYPSPPPSPSRSNPPSPPSSPKRPRLRRRSTRSPSRHRSTRPPRARLPPASP